MTQTNNISKSYTAMAGLKFTYYCLFMLLLSTTVLWAQRTQVIDSKGTINTTGNTVTTAATAPTTPTPIQGDMWYDTSVTGDTRTKVWNGTSWSEISPADIGTWVNNTNGGSYAINDLVIHNGDIYRNLTGTNSDTTPDADTTNWLGITEQNIDSAIPVWQSQTNGGL